jgi:hypothetical protein
VKTILTELREKFPEFTKRASSSARWNQSAPYILYRIKIRCHINLPSKCSCPKWPHLPRLCGYNLERVLHPACPARHSAFSSTVKLFSRWDKLNGSVIDHYCWPWKGGWTPNHLTTHFNLLSETNNSSQFIFRTQSSRCEDRQNK